MPFDVLFTPAPNMERVLWNAFKKQARKQDPLASKYDHRYYERLRNAYKAQRDSTPNLDRWLSNGSDRLRDAQSCIDGE